MGAGVGCVGVVRERQRERKRGREREGERKESMGMGVDALAEKGRKRLSECGEGERET